MGAAVRIEAGARLGPQNGEEAPDFGEETGGGGRGLCRRADGFALGLGCRERRKEEGRAIRARAETRRRLESWGHFDLLRPPRLRPSLPKGRGSKKKCAAGRGRRAEKSGAKDWAPRGSGWLSSYLERAGRAERWMAIAGARRAGACVGCRSCPSARGWCV